MSAKKKAHLTLISNLLSVEERIQARISAFQRELYTSNDESHMQYIEEILRVIYDYLNQFEDQDLEQSVFKIKEAIFYLVNWREM